MMEKITASFSAMAYKWNEKVFGFSFRRNPRLNLTENFDEFETFRAKDQLEHLL